MQPGFISLTPRHAYAEKFFNIEYTGLFANKLTAVIVVKPYPLEIVHLNVETPENVQLTVDQEKQSSQLHDLIQIFEYQIQQLQKLANIWPDRESSNKELGQKVVALHSALMKFVPNTNDDKYAFRALEKTFTSAKATDIFIKDLGAFNVLSGEFTNEQIPLFSSKPSSATTSTTAASASVPAAIPAASAAAKKTPVTGNAALLNKITERATKFFAELSDPNGFKRSQERYLVIEHPSFPKIRMLNPLCAVKDIVEVRFRSYLIYHMVVTTLSEIAKSEAFKKLNVEMEKLYSKLTSDPSADSKS